MSIKTPVRYIEGNEYMPCGFIEDAGGGVIDLPEIVTALNALRERVAELEAEALAKAQMPPERLRAIAERSGRMRELEQHNAALLAAAKAANKYLADMAARGGPRPGLEGIEDWSRVQSQLSDAIGLTAAIGATNAT